MDILLFHGLSRVCERIGFGATANPILRKEVKVPVVRFTERRMFSRPRLEVGGKT